jgi:hypothetical protein
MKTMNARPYMALRLCAGVATVATTAFALAACTSGPPGNDPIAIDGQYGIPAYSVPSDILRPDGLMTNGLLPAQPYDSGG